MKRFLALLLALTAFAGCLGAEDEPMTVTPVDEHDEHDHNMTDGRNMTANNTAPFAALELEGDAVAGTPTAFLVNVTDADGQAVSWIFDADGDGEADLNGTGSLKAVFTYDAAGSYEANLTATDGTDNTTVTLTVDVAEGLPPTDPNAPEDRGWYTYDPTTGLCAVKEYTVLIPGFLYNSPLSGGDWYIMESNSVDGLQIADNHPIGDDIGSGLDTPDCVDGDQVLL